MIGKLHMRHLYGEVRAKYDNIQATNSNSDSCMIKGADYFRKQQVLRLLVEMPGRRAALRAAK